MYADCGRQRSFISTALVALNTGFEFLHQIAEFGKCPDVQRGFRNSRPQNVRTARTRMEISLSAGIYLLEEASSYAGCKINSADWDTSTGKKCFPARSDRHRTRNGRTQDVCKLQLLLIPSPFRKRLFMNLIIDPLSTSDYLTFSGVCCWTLLPQSSTLPASPGFMGG